MLFTGFELQLQEMLPCTEFEPDPAYNPIILALCRMGDQVRPVVLFWNSAWIDEQGQARNFVSWVYLTLRKET